MPDSRAYIQALAKHLPPSNASLRLLDIDGLTGPVLREQRGDLAAAPATFDADWGVEANTVDAVAVYDRPPDPHFLRRALAALRPGGRLMMVQPAGVPDAALVETLTTAGFVRILVEPALETGGVLLRGEKPHTEAHTMDRIRQVAERDTADDLAHYTGRYVHLLIRQSPNKPVWALRADDVLRWEAVALLVDDQPVLLAFSGLPKAVALMQPAVMAGMIRDVNKVGKFSRDTAQGWPYPVLLNPTLEALSGKLFTLVPVDPQTAEAPDE